MHPQECFVQGDLKPEGLSLDTTTRLEAIVHRNGNEVTEAQSLTKASASHRIYLTAL